MKAEYILKNNETLIIREATENDAAALLEYVDQVAGETDYLTFGSGEFELTEAQERDYLKKNLNSDSDIYIVGVINGKIAASLNFSAGKRSRLAHCGSFGMSVLKKYHGIGVGSFMLDTLIQWAKKSETVKKIDLQVRTDNRAALSLYIKKGFSVEGTLKKQMYFQGTYYDNYWMGLEI